jgi:hypothetical protein
MATPVPSRSRAIAAKSSGGLLEPIQIVGPQPQRHLPRLLRRPRTIGVDHEGNVAAGGLACRPDFGLLGFVKLDVTIALRHRLSGARRDLLRVAILQQAGIGRQPVAPCPTEQPVQRQTGRLAGDVPQRDVESGKSEDRDAVAAEQMQLLLQVVAEFGDVARVPADRQGSHHVVQGGANGIGAGVAERLAPADDAGIGFHSYEQDVVGRPGAQTFTLMTAAESVRHLYRLRVDARDLHSTLPFLLMSASKLSAWGRSASRLDAKRGSPAGTPASR